MVSQDANGTRYALIICGDRTSFPARTQIFAGIKAKGCCMAHASGLLPCVLFLREILSSVRLASIFDNNQLVFARKLENGIHVHNLPVDVNWDHRSNWRIELPMN